MKKYLSVLAVIAAALLSATSCIQDLNIEPVDDDVVLPADILTGVEQYEQVLAKCYIGLAVSGPAGENSGDIDGIDNGFGQYIRALFYMQELTTDAAHCVWDDKTVRFLHYMKWTRSDVFVRSMFSRGYYQISMCNELIRQAEASQFKDDAKIQQYIAEAKALRLLSYLHIVDMFGYEHVPFATEETSVGSVGPAPNLNLIDWMEEQVDELLSTDKLAEIRKAEYGRVDKGFVQMLKAKLNLNAPVYLNLSGAEAKPYYEKAAEACKAIVAAYPALHSNYQELFMADNDRCTDEIIFGVEAKAGETQTWGATQFLIRSTYEEGDAETGNRLGMNSGGWGGVVVTPTFLQKFDRTNDARFIFDGGPNNYPETMDDPGSFKTAWTSHKFSNMASTGNIYEGATFVDTDFPLFRAADAYLMLAECQLRGAGNVTESEAKAAWNAVRARAGLGNVSNYSLDELLDERGRELYWEGHRRSDLIRFGKYTGNAYLWTWKGEEYNGTSVADHLKLFPIPDAEYNTNSLLGQNPGY
ncbi:MAG: RagB/SusD family nutrient uptake outer membrane protein [Bacteroidales bacterium]|nr:RagB/SusD family nutrient uptake outer membrane protein [Bacteroidales bacterium]